MFIGVQIACCVPLWLLSDLVTLVRSPAVICGVRPSLMLSWWLCLCPWHVSRIMALVVVNVVIAVVIVRCPWSCHQFHQLLAVAASILLLLQVVWLPIVAFFKYASSLCRANLCCCCCLFDVAPMLLLRLVNDAVMVSLSWDRHCSCSCAGLPCPAMFRTCPLLDERSNDEQ